ncbi:polysaccharide deacetylase family protein [Emcibacteraceae bacterium]|nr:polysaccharide deacetylase family protein [Emcibacteraceae bacterium]MDC0081577.1 polysaccharide deacetylase family protein [Emcibacteraceae bacterium]
MSLDKSYLEYPKRQYGMDHNRYDWSMLSDRKLVNWPNGKKLALWINVSLQFFPLNQQGVPAIPIGGMAMPYPDLRHYSLRDYGNRVGIYRMLKAFDKYDVVATYAVNGQLAQRTPYLLNAIKERNAEIIAHGWNMDSMHHNGLSLSEENDLVSRTLDALRPFATKDINGWLSPSRLESDQTPEVLKKNEGIEYFCDWVNDDMPYEFKTGNGPLMAMPLSNELEDRFILLNNLHSEQSYGEQIKDAADLLISEAEEQGGRILGLSLHPWMIGQPHRIKFLEDILDYLMSKEGVWSASASEILNSWQSQQ